MTKTRGTKNGKLEAFRELNLRPHIINECKLRSNNPCYLQTRRLTKPKTSPRLHRRHLNHHRVDIFTLERKEGKSHKNKTYSRTRTTDDLLTGTAAQLFYLLYTRPCCTRKKGNLTKSRIIPDSNNTDDLFNGTAAQVFMYRTHFPTYSSIRLI